VQASFGGVKWDLARPPSSLAGWPAVLALAVMLTYGQQGRARALAWRHEPSRHERRAGIVIGEAARIGDHVTLMQYVTLGGTGKEGGDRHPKVGDFAQIAAHSTVLGAPRLPRAVGTAGGFSVQAFCTNIKPAVLVHWRGPLPPAALLRPGRVVLLA